MVSLSGIYATFFLFFFATFDSVCRQEDDKAGSLLKHVAPDLVKCHITI